MAGEKTVETTGLLGWLDRRFPVTSTWKAHLSEYYAPKNFNFWYFFGSLALLVLVLQIVTGIFLVMHYKPDAERAFQSVEYIMREVPWGWLVRYMHSTGASMFFVVVYLHMLRGLLYGSYRKPRELVWIFGVAIFLCLMAEAFFGYLLPWGQMSYWGAQVIVNLFAAIPFIGPELSIWIRGDYVVSDATLNRFFAFHVIAIPLVLIGLVAAHLVALHEVGSNNPDGVEIKQGPKDKYGRPKDGIPFHPFYSVHDLVGVAGFLLVFAAIVFFAPEMGGYFLEFNNFIPADSLKTPPHIAPVWYFTPFYSMLRATTDEFTWVLAGASVLGAIVLFAKSNLKGFMRIAVPGILIVVAVLLRVIDAKFWGVVAMGGTVVILFFLPWLDHSPVKSIRYRPTWHKWIYGIFMVNFLVLGYIGTQPPSPPLNLTSQIGTLLYLAFFFLMPVWSRLGTFKQVPDRVTFHAH
ncbi:cytochrome bc complex cytochrome b subunit [Achromobacter mucicolens]|jgi:ubiquinol-cytochrome c reductase cytochrome b subunit|uniref:Cytochrome b n=1 Tax=Achromobacter mucicolens TaxID=1389922 RepID=A0ABD4YQA0_9BURK|nr:MULTISPECIES: cytochrome bc complex cytochrome b subunit [Achromobacter]KXJ65374.1 cytochrome B [Achromobacter xylosoxidans]OXC88939.1 cytochrome b [Achromobacter sp. KAs 3-5]PJI54528.1 cytochrome b [Methylobacterium radiotolerans]KRB15148.1 cytochrome B [Achromobacter sp. Root170]MBV7498735.1 cytochrome bc complex cytochrome b subunit [Achromobacter sp. ACM05]